METTLTILLIAFSFLRMPVSIAPSELDSFCASAEGERARVCGIARDVEAAVASSPTLPFDGPAAKHASAVALLTVAIHESGLRASVQDCSYCDPVRNPTACDGGRSLSLYQLMTGRAWAGHTRDELCTDNALATRLALRWLTRASKGGTAPMFRTYAGCGLLRAGCKPATELATLFDTLAAKAGIEPVPRNGPRFYRFKASAASSDHEHGNEGK